MNNKEEKINKATDEFLAIYNSKDRKFTYLPEWLEFMTNSFNKEINVRKNHSTFLYDKYKRGAIVRVNFGTNIGSEMSGIHFGIVVTKNDNESNRTLQVIPLSSKKGNFRVPINDEIFRNVIEHFVKDFHEVNNKIDYVKHKLIVDSFITLTNIPNILTLTEVREVMENLVKILRQDIVQYASIYLQECINMLQESMGEFSSDSGAYQYLNNIKNNFQDNMTKLIDMETKSSQYADIFEEYLKYDKNSYMLVKDFTTISKEKIISLNTYDPSGQIRVSENTLNIIDKKIVEYFTK